MPSDICQPSHQRGLMEGVELTMSIYQHPDLLHSDQSCMEAWSPRLIEDPPRWGGLASLPSADLGSWLSQEWF